MPSNRHIVGEIKEAGQRAWRRGLTKMKKAIYYKYYFSKILIPMYCFGYAVITSR